MKSVPEKQVGTIKEQLATDLLLGSHKYAVGGGAGVIPAWAVLSPTWHHSSGADPGGPEPGGGNRVHGDGDEPNPRAIQGVR